MLLVLAHDHAPGELLATVAGMLAPHATVEVESLSWGSLLIADAPHARSERWLVAGRSVRDPWGLPTADLALDEVVAEYDRYGPAAAHLGAGPHAVVDLEQGRLLRPPNGIVPAFSGHGPRGLVLGTTRGAVHGLAGDNVENLPPGAIAGPGGVSQLAITLPPERLRALRWVWLTEELAEQVARLGPLSPAALPRGVDAPAADDGWLRRTDAGDLVFLPPVGHGDARARGLGAAMASRLWARARLGGSWLFAPTRERPVRDTIALMTGSGS